MLQVPGDLVGRAALESAKGVIRSEVAWTPDFANLGYLAPLDGTPALKNQDDFLKQAVASTKYEDKTYAVPQVIDSMGIFYNKKLLKEAGVEAPANLDDLKTAAKKIKDKTGKTGLYLRGDGGQLVVAGFHTENPEHDRPSDPDDFATEIGDSAVAELAPLLRRRWRDADGLRPPVALRVKPERGA